MKLSINPSILDDLQTFAEYLENFMIMPDLKAYRPRRRPLTADSARAPEGVRRVRRQIVREWFHFVVWSVRLKKFLKGELSEELLHFETQRNAYKYRNALQRMTTPQKEQHKEPPRPSDPLALPEPHGEGGDYIDSFMREFESV